jgi:branched-chain amino acid transport system ATP-binding protein
MAAAPTDNPPALVVEQLEAAHEPGLPIVRGANLQVETGEIVAILGPNGAGKSTLVKAVAGLVPVTGERSLLFGRDITRVPAHRMVFEGLAFVPQTENVFVNLSIAENLELAAAIVRADRRERLDPVYAMFPTWHASATCQPGSCRAGSARCWPWRGP